MKILMFVQSQFGAILHWPRRNYFDFYQSLGYLATSIYQYGPGEQELWGTQIAPLEYDKAHTMDDILKFFNPDVVLLFSWVGVRKWLKSRSKYSRNIPFVCLSGDYFSVPPKFKGWHDQWDLLIHRGNCHDDPERTVPSVWLPQALSEREFYTDPERDYLDGRENLIVWVGNTSKFPHYETRITALKKLRPTGLLKDIGLLNLDQDSRKAKLKLTVKQTMEVTEAYPKTLKKYIGAYTCAGHELHSTLAKHFEIMGSGTAMLTQSINLSDVLFGKKQCFFTYKDDLSDLIPMAKEILNDHAKVKKVTENALRVINKYHLHHHRRIEFYDILKAMINGQEIPRKWGK